MTAFVARMPLLY